MKSLWININWWSVKCELVGEHRNSSSCINSCITSASDLWYFIVKTCVATFKTWSAPRWEFWFSSSTCARPSYRHFNAVTGSLPWSLWDLNQSRLVSLVNRKQGSSGVWHLILILCFPTEEEEAGRKQDKNRTQFPKFSFTVVSVIVLED